VIYAGPGGRLFVWGGLAPAGTLGVALLAQSHFSLRRALGLALSTAALLVLSLSYIVGSSFNPFIYFRF